MALTPVEIRHIQLKRGLFGYRKASVHRMMDDIADSFETVWRERSQLVERVEELETEVTRHVELEALLRSTLVSAERASQDLKEAARREADVIVTEANAEARKVMRDAITREGSADGRCAPRPGAASLGARCRRRGSGRVHRDAGSPAAATTTEEHPGWTVETRGSQPRPTACRRRPLRPSRRNSGSSPGRTSILGAWSPAPSASTSASRPAPAARPSSGATATPGSCASPRRPSVAARTRRW